MSLIAKEVKEDDHENNISIWTREQEALLAKWADKALCYRWLHDLSEKKFSHLNNFIQIPVIILSTATGALNVGVSAVFPESFVDKASILLGGINIMTGIISTIGNFLRYAQNMEGHKIASIQWSKFQRNIAAEIAIHPDQRQNAGEFFTICRAEMDRLLESSPSVPNDIIGQFESKFKHTKISKPEICNVLEPTTIFKPHDGEDWVKKMTEERERKKTEKMSAFANSETIRVTDTANATGVGITRNTGSPTGEVITYDNNTQRESEHSITINFDTMEENNSRRREESKVENSPHVNAILASLNK